MFALALHSRRENEKRASEKRRATISSARLQQRGSLNPIPKQSLQPAPTSEEQPVPSADQSTPKKSIDGHRFADSKSRSYSAITVIRTKAPGDVLSAAGVDLTQSEPGDGSKSETDKAAPSAMVLRESGPRVLVVRMTPDQHKAAAAQLKRQMTQPALMVHQVPTQEPANRKLPPLEKKLSK